MLGVGVCVGVLVIVGVGVFVLVGVGVGVKVGVGVRVSVGVCVGVAVGRAATSSGVSGSAVGIKVGKGVDGPQPVNRVSKISQLTIHRGFIVVISLYNCIILGCVRIFLLTSKRMAYGGWEMAAIGCGLTDFSRSG
jgi:hypothetical protein